MIVFFVETLQFDESINEGRALILSVVLEVIEVFFEWFQFEFLKHFLHRE